MNSKLSRLSPTRLHAEYGFLTVDLIFGMAILVVAFMPLAFLFVHERQLLRAEYSRSVAMEIVDGEMEILAAGEWRDFPEGSQVYMVHAQAAAGLPPGQFQLARTGNHLRLEWKSAQPHGIGLVVREITVK